MSGNRVKTMKDSSVEDLVERARLEIIFKHPFYGSLAMCLATVVVADGSDLAKRIWGDNPPTAATDGKSMFFHEAFVRTMTFNELVGVMLHEVMHYALAHCLRLGGRDPKLWNVVGDLIINESIVADSFELPKDALRTSNPEIMKNFSFPPNVNSGNCAQVCGSEELYEYLLKGVQKKGGKGPDGPKWGYVIEPTDGQGNPLSQEEKDMLEREGQANVIAAASRSAGKVPGLFQGVIEKAREAQVDWRAVMFEFITQGQPTRVTWDRPNRKLRAHGYYLPSRKKRQIGPIVAFVDTSASVPDSEQEQFLGEFQKLGGVVDIEEIIIVPVDYVVHENGITRYKSGEPIKSIPTNGRGGTTFVTAFEWLAKQDIHPARVMYFTDMEGQFPDVPYPVPTLWIATTKAVAPWGKTVNIDTGRGY